MFGLSLEGHHPSRLILISIDDKSQHSTERWLQQLQKWIRHRWWHSKGNCATLDANSIRKWGKVKKKIRLQINSKSCTGGALLTWSFDLINPINGKFSEFCRSTVVSCHATVFRRQLTSTLSPTQLSFKGKFETISEQALHHLAQT